MSSFYYTKFSFWISLMITAVTLINEILSLGDSAMQDLISTIIIFSNVINYARGLEPKYKTTSVLTCGSTLTSELVTLWKCSKYKQTFIFKCWLISVFVSLARKLQTKHILIKQFCKSELLISVNKLHLETYLNKYWFHYEWLCGK